MAVEAREFRMAQAKGVLPTKGDDREVLYRNPRTCGYFVGVQLAAGQSPDQLEQWLTSLSAAVDALVARGDPSIKQPEGEKFASVAVGLRRGVLRRGAPRGWSTTRPDRPWPGSTYHPSPSQLS